MRYRWITLAVLLVSCSGPPATRIPAAEAVATWTGAAIGLPELDEGLATARTPACLALRRTRGGGSLEELVPCYREVAEALALERLVLAALPEGVDRALADLEGYEQLRRQAYLATYLRRLSEEVEVSDDEIETRFEANRDRYRRKGAFRLWNIFRRHEDATAPEKTIELLLGIKERFEAGETFDSLAREFSHSETRARGGLVGNLQTGALPEKLEKIAFALEDGEISDPVRVKGGAVLLHVRNVVEEAQLSLQQVRQRIQGELASIKTRERIAEDASGLKPPSGSTVLSRNELVEALDGGDPERVALEIAGRTLTVDQLRRMAGLAPTDLASELPEESRKQLEEAYRSQENRQLLALDLVESAPTELRQEAQEQLQEMAVSRLVDERLREEMSVLVDADPDRLEGYWADNRHHYQSSLRFKLRVWDQPFGDEPPRLLWQMSELRESLAAGDLDLDAAAAKTGGSVADLGWREYDSLSEEFSQAALAHLLEVGASGFTAPYQQDGALHLVWLEQREEPGPMEYEEVRDRVREDYVARFEQQLYRRALETRLATAGFLFDEDTLRQLLLPPSSGNAE